MQAIETKYLSPTNFKPSRIKAECARGSITLSWPQELSGDDCHRWAVTQLVNRFVAEDAAKYGSQMGAWQKPFVTGTVKSGKCVHVFVA